MPKTMLPLSGNNIVTIFAGIIGGGIVNTAVLGWLAMSMLRITSRIDKLEVHVLYIREFLDPQTPNPPYRLPPFKNIGRTR